MESGRILGILTVVTFVVFPFSAESRQTIPLDGTWDIAEGPADQIPSSFPSKIPVPGLVDVATPSLGVSRSETPRSYYWYRRTFTVDGPVPDVARLKIHKAMYGTNVYLNGTFMGEHWPCFTPGYYDVRSALNGNGATNTLVVRVGPWGELPDGIPNGGDGENGWYPPGIYDSVQVILSGTPHILRVKTAPDLSNNTVKVYVYLANAGTVSAGTMLSATVLEAATGVVRGRETTSSPIAVAGGADAETEVVLTVGIDQCKYWSPESPFLYRLVVAADADSFATRFGMRSIGWDPTTYRMTLNGKPYMLLGTNICIRRFDTDPLRGALPYDEKWVRMVMRRFRSANWNCYRNSIGFPPEIWYRLADEEGLLVQDEFPHWGWSGSKPGTLEENISEFTDWINERVNHPCVFVWDPQNEGESATGNAAMLEVRDLDPQGRWWENSQDGNTIGEVHVYDDQPKFATLNPTTWTPGRPWAPMIINEYAWLWIRRDGSYPGSFSPMQLKHWGHGGGYEGPGAEGKIAFFNRYVCTAAKTEYHRISSSAAGIMDFVGLSNDPYTCDHWEPDIANPRFHESFLRYMPNAFSPLMVGINGCPTKAGAYNSTANTWSYTSPAPGSEDSVQVIVINDSHEDWAGTVSLRLQQNRQYVWTLTQDAAVQAYKRTGVTFGVTYPQVSGKARIEAFITANSGEVLHSVRDFGIGGVWPVTPEDVIEPPTDTQATVGVAGPAEWSRQQRPKVLPSLSVNGREGYVRLAVPRPSAVRMELYTTHGRLVRTLADGPMAAGDHVVPLNGRNGCGETLTKGQYICRLRAGGAVRTTMIAHLR